jgi:hypothetical protein
MSTSKVDYDATDLSHEAWMARLDKAHGEFAQKLSTIVPKSHSPVRYSEFDTTTGRYQFCTMNQVDYAVIEDGHPDAVCLLWEECRHHPSIRIDLTNVTWDMLADILEGALTCADGMESDTKVWHDMRHRIATNAAFLDQNLEATTASFSKPRHRLARQNVSFEGGLAYNFSSGPLRPNEPNGLILAWYWWHQTHRNETTFSPGCLTRARAHRMETQARAKIIEIIEEDDLTEADFVEIVKDGMRASAKTLGLRDPWGKTKPKYQEPRLNCLRGEVQEQTILGEMNEWFFDVDRMPTPPVARTVEEVDDDTDGSADAPNRLTAAKGEVATTHKDNVTSVANTSSRRKGAPGNAPVSRKTLGGPHHPSKDEMTSKGDDTGKDKSQDNEGDDDDDDDRDDEPDPGEEGSRTQSLSQWRYGVDPYTVDDATLDRAINEKWHFSRFKYYNAVRGAITRKSLPPQHTIFGDDIRGELLQLHEDNQIQGLELRRWYPGVFASEKCGLNRDLVPLGLPYLIDGTYAEAYEAVILCGEDALDHGFACDMAALLEHNKTKRNKKLTPPWKRERKTIDAFHKAYPLKESRTWLRASEFTANLEHLQTWPVEIDLYSINQDENFYAMVQTLLKVDDDTIQQAIGQFHDDCGLLRNDLRGFTHPRWSEGDEVVVHEYTDGDVLTCNARFFVGRMNCRNNWTPATEALVSTMQEEQSKAAKRKGKQRMVDPVTATKNTTVTPPTQTIPGAEPALPKMSFLDYHVATPTTVDKPTTFVNLTKSRVTSVATPTTVDKPTTFVDLTKSRVTSVDAAIKAAEKSRKRPRDEEVAPAPQQLPQARLILNKDDKTLFDIFTLRPMFDDDIANDAILLFRQQWQRDQPMEIALPPLVLPTTTHESTRLIANATDRALFERYTRRPILDDDICNAFILLCRRQFARDRRRSSSTQPTSPPVPLQTPTKATTTTTTTTAITKSADKKAAPKKKDEDHSTTTTKPGKAAIMQTWLKTPEKTTPAAPTPTQAAPTPAPTAPTPPPPAPTTPTTPTPTAPQPPPPKSARGGRGGRGGRAKANTAAPSRRSARITKKTKTT